jgi:hypothetical protein
MLTGAAGRFGAAFISGAALTSASHSLRVILLV